MNDDALRSSLKYVSLIGYFTNVSKMIRRCYSR